MFWFISKVCAAIMPSFISLCLLNVYGFIGNANVQFDIYYYYYCSINIKIRNEDQLTFYVFKIDQPKVLLNENYEPLRTIKFICEIILWVICKLNFPTGKTNWIQFETSSELYRSQTNLRNQDMWRKYSICVAVAIHSHESEWRT